MCIDIKFTIANYVLTVYKLIQRQTLITLCVTIQSTVTETVYCRTSESIKG